MGRIGPGERLVRPGGSRHTARMRHTVGAPGGPQWNSHRPWRPSALSGALVGVVLLTGVGCSSASTGPSENTAATVSAIAPSAIAASPIAPSTATLSVAPSTRTPPPVVAPAPSAGPDAVAFFRAQEAGCRTHAEATGNPQVEPDRFAGARRVRDLSGGATLVEDGRGTRLVVEAAKGIVLPASGQSVDLMPAPYGFGCPATIFVGGAD